MPAMKHLKAVVFDWAGTVVDFGSLAPMGVFVEVFGEFGVPITIEEARIPMGMAKRDHLRAVMALPRVGAQWQEVHGSPPDERAIDRLRSAIKVPSPRRRTPFAVTSATGVTR